ncbi:MBL fold metallo-hydrolase [Flavisphingomonas formosensis]|uniref:MBL fold metallo-hydrolase n=1 Tax=Flavisphingomonas formosensis TaxID=861534 RepID=UPI0012FCFC24|nr:MBL fold metallo-hydrolase [Sphingomonas formosensis]
MARASDESLLGDEGFVPTTHKGLTYPFGDRGPASGECIDVAPGVGWARLPIPGGLEHINVWLLDDRDEAGEGVAIVDTGMDLKRSRAVWDALFEGPLAGRRVTRIFSTHFHPDHAGLAGWLCDRFGVRLWMARTEWLMLSMLYTDQRPEPPREATAMWHAAGWSDAEVAEVGERGWGRFAQICSQPPAGHMRLADGDEVRIGARTWRIVVGSGHTPEHACLWDEAGGLLIAGDQVLPRITSNVSLSLIEPEGDPLGDWLASIDRFRAMLPPDLLVLPAHGGPFAGLHARLEALRSGHQDRLIDLHRFLASPARAKDCFEVLFRRRLSGDDLILATGETLAHLRRLEVDGRVARETQDGVWWFRALAPA